MEATVEVLGAQAAHRAAVEGGGEMVAELCRGAPLPALDLVDAFSIATSCWPPIAFG